MVGAVNVHALRHYNVFRTMSIANAFDWTEDMSMLSDAEAAGLYGVSWMFVHWLYNTRPEPFAKYQIELAKGTDPAKAWRIAFPGFDAEAAERELHNYSKRGDYQEFMLPLHSHSVTPVSATMSPADTHVARARILFTAAGFVKTSDRKTRLAEARAEIATALALDATNAEALELDSASPVVERLERVRRAAQAHPDDPRIVRLLGSLLLNHPGADAAERERVNRRAVELDPLDPYGLNNLAWFFVRQKRPMDALPFALRAVKRAPQDAGVIDTYAMALFYAGRCQTAIEHERRALELMRDASASSSLRAELGRHLSQMKASCSDDKSAVY